MENEDIFKSLTSTKAKRLEFYMKAKKLILKGRITFICDTIDYIFISKTGTVPFEPVLYFPELLKQKPKKAQIGYRWWPRDNTKSRLTALDNCIELCKPKTKKNNGKK